MSSEGRRLLIAAQASMLLLGLWIVAKPWL